MQKRAIGTFRCISRSTKAHKTELRSNRLSTPCVWAAAKKNQTRTLHKTVDTCAKLRYQGQLQSRAPQNQHNDTHLDFLIFSARPKASGYCCTIAIRSGSIGRSGRLAVLSA